MQTDRGGLIRLSDHDGDFIVDLRYATDDNFTGQRIYNSSECWLYRHTAEILIKARDMFRADGYRVKIWDAYRPVSAQRRFWELMPDDDFVARPPDMSAISVFRPTHMNGMCVDVTLTDLEGRDIEMPSAFDDMSRRASLELSDCSETARENGRYLKRIMESAGFRGYDKEWWHFYDVTAEPVPFMDFPI